MNLYKRITSILFLYFLFKFWRTPASEIRMFAFSRLLSSYVQKSQSKCHRFLFICVYMFSSLYSIILERLLILVCTGFRVVVKPIDWLCSDCPINCNHFGLAWTVLIFLPYQRLLRRTSNSIYAIPNESHSSTTSLNELRISQLYF